MKNKIIMCLILGVCILVVAEVKVPYAFSAQGQQHLFSDRSPVIEGKINMPAQGGDNVVGYGVRGETSGQNLRPYTAYGVYGITNTKYGAGVFGDIPRMGPSCESAGVKGLGGKYGVYGQGAPYGIYGKTSSECRYAVYGNADHGNTVGVYGEAQSPNSYAVYSEGKAKVEGDLEVTGKIPAYTNLARLPGIVTVRSGVGKIEGYESFGKDYSPFCVNDGKINRWDEGEWATNKKSAGYFSTIPKVGASDFYPWIQLDFAPVQNMNIIKFYDRPNRYDKIFDAYLYVSSASGTKNFHLGMFPYGCAPKVVYLDENEGKGVKSIKLVITEVGPDTKNVGLSEIECFYDKSIW